MCTLRSQDIPGEGEGCCEFHDGKVVVIGAAVIVRVRQPGAGGDGDLAVSGVGVVMLGHNNPDIYRSSNGSFEIQSEPDLKDDTG